MRCDMKQRPLPRCELGTLQFRVDAFNENILTIRDKIDDILPSASDMSSSMS